MKHGLYFSIILLNGQNDKKCSHCMSLGLMLYEFWTRFSRFQNPEQTTTMEEYTRHAGCIIFVGHIYYTLFFGKGHFIIFVLGSCLLFRFLFYSFFLDQLMVAG